MAKIELLSTWLDVVQLVPGLWDKDTVTFTVCNKSQILGAIKSADDSIRSSLRKIYPNLSVAPWYKPPISDKNNGNTESYIIPNLTIGASAVTEVFTINFINTLSFSITGDISGAQAVGSISSEYAVPGVITIPTAAWSGTFDTDYQFYISLFASDPLIAKISAKLAAAEILDSVMSDQVPNSTDVIEKYRSWANDQLEALRDQEIYLSSDPIAVNLTPERTFYNIDNKGMDVTEYIE